MLITRIEQLGRSRYKIYLDNKPAFVLYRGELNQYKISENNDMSDETYNQILEEVLVKRARLRAMNLLMKHSFTVRQLRDKLSDGFYPETIIQNAIDYVSSFGYVDDRKYAKDYVECHRDDKSSTRIKNDLLNKGIDKDIVIETINDIMQSDDPIHEDEQIKKLLIKKHYCNEMPYEDKQKIYAFLYRKGFSTEKIRRAMSLDFDE